MGVEQKVDSAGVASYIPWYEWFVPPPANLPPGTKVDNNGYPLAWIAKPNGKYQYIYQTNIPNFSVLPGLILSIGNRKKRSKVTNGLSL